jgi:hypothetical protein
MSFRVNFYTLKRKVNTKNTKTFEFDLVWWYNYLDLKLIKINMNYQMLKTLLDSLVLNFRCPSCSSGVIDNNIEIV